MNNITSFSLYLIFTLLLSIFIMCFSFFLCKKDSYLSKLSIYECGFSSFHKPNNPFSMSFFLIGILFLMFDLEMMFLFPWSVNTNNLLIEHQYMVFIFTMFIMMGLYYEWIQGGLDWQ